ncbi:MAG: haloacid dehalogenase, type II [Pelagibacterium sp. SCN 63-23]|nr:MAG: haloacid dehalogenase, type II [Pelagibacterium sp. SCN 63-23]
MQLTDFKVLTFDCYGTLIDWETGMIENLRPLTDKVGDQLTRDAILEAHARHESFHQAQTPGRRYSDILSTVYLRLAEEWGVPVSLEECRDYGHSVGNWPAFEDSAGALAYLKRFYKLVILSNVDHQSFTGAMRKLQVDFDGIYTAEDIGSYKPSMRNFDYMLEMLSRLGHGKEDILHTAESMFHDHKPANAAGLKSAWIYRRHDKSGFGATMNPGEMPSYDFRFNSMADLVKAHQEALRGNDVTG